MTPAEVPDDLVEKAARGMWSTPPQDPDSALAWPSWDVAVERSDAGLWDLPQMVSDTRHLARHALAAALPSHKQQVTAKYRLFVKTVREIAQGDSGTDEISPTELQQALTDLRHGRQ